MAADEKIELTFTEAHVAAEIVNDKLVRLKALLEKTETINVPAIRASTLKRIEELTALRDKLRAYSSWLIEQECARFAKEMLGE